MSCYCIDLKNKQSGEIHRIFAIDNYFGSHEYGYKLPNGDVLNGDKLDILYEKGEDNAG